MSEDSKVNARDVPNYSATGSGAGLSSVITQTDASGKPMQSYGDGSSKQQERDSSGSSGEVPRARGWRRFCCFSCGTSAREDDETAAARAAYLTAEFDSIEIDYDEVEVLRSARRTPLMAPVPRPLAGRACLILDLDETLVHSSFKPVPNADFIIPVEIEGIVHRVYVIKRPGCDEFLRRAGKLYEIVIFTASLAKYANPLLDKLDIHNVISARLFREACLLYQGKYVKDLALVGRDLRRTIIVDNSPCSYMFHPENAIGCESFIDDPADRTLHVMTDFLESIHDVPDVRKWLHGWQGVTYLS